MRTKANNSTQPQVNWELVASRAGYSNGACAKTRYGQIKKAIGHTTDGAIAAPTPVKSRSKKPGSGTNVNASKVKKSTASKGKKAKPVAAAAEHEGDDDEGDDDLMQEGPIKQEFR